MDQHPNVGRTEAFLHAYDAADTDALRSLLAEDVVWRVGGSHRLSGEYVGRDAVLDYFAAANNETGGSLKLEPLEILANDHHGAVFLRVTADREGKRLDATLAEALTFDDEGAITEFWATANDQAAIDEFWA